ncbi:hypothetical protein AC579_5097 [Pseudocercospora musae]|uniref:Cupin type-1 domain-containing protein n=1 Tax=Pseudocercospora musae TaxID=113226 RepID=A0A139IN68_9PEZI|nr:hypothetical protein AC579_5097 [Pseudocercospora musae]
MVQVKQYQLPPTKLVPNSPHPLLHYPGLLKKEAGYDAAKIYDLVDSNGWKTQWIFRYGPTQQSHYHTEAHECMTVLTGEATIRFGVGDLSDDLEASTHGTAREDGGIEIHAEAGDVFILPAGTAHKTHHTTPAEFALLTPGGATHIAGDDPTQVLRDIKLSGFTMMGCYPKGSSWDFAIRAKDQKEFKKSWNVPKPDRDPVLGASSEGLCGTWKEKSRQSKL